MVKEEKKKMNGKSAPKLSYEELAGLASQMHAENKRLKAALEESSARMQVLETRDYYERLSWLWRVFTLENCIDLFGKDFVLDKIKEFKILMTPIQNEPVKENIDS